MRWLIRSIGALISLVVLVAAGVFLIPAERLAQLAATQIEMATGRAVEIDGGVRPMLWPAPGVATGPVRIANADWAGEAPMLAAQGMQLRLDLAEALRGRLSVERIAIEAPDILLQRAADGRVNWDFGTGSGAGGRPGAGSAGPGELPVVAEARITDGRLRWRDAADGTDLTLDRIDATLRLPDPAGPADLSVGLRLNGVDLRASATVDRPAAALAGAVVPVRLALEAGAARARFDGRAGGDAAEGRLEVQAPGLGALLAPLGVAAPAGSAGAVSLAAQVTRSPAGSLHLRDAVLALGTNRVTGGADLTLDGPRPMLRASLDAGRLDLSALTAGGGGGAPASAAAAPAGWSAAPFDAAALGMLDADVALRLDALDLGTLRMGPARLGLAIDRARAVLTVHEAALYGGTATGELVANNRSGFSAGGRLALRGLRLAPFLSDMAGLTRLDGTGNADIQFLAVGNSMDALMRRLSGTARFDLSDGAILGFDLAGMLRNLDPRYVGEGQRTIYNRLSGSFVVDEGIARTTDTRLEARAVTATTTGAVDIGRRTLDLRIVPVALTDAEGAGGVRVPLLVTGAWEAPRLRLDVQGMAEERLRAEAEQRLRERLAAEENERVQDAARRRAEEEAARRLGIEAQEGESARDAARRALEEEASRRLRGLLGGGN